MDRAHRIGQDEPIVCRPRLTMGWDGRNQRSRSMPRLKGPRKDASSLRRTDPTVLAWWALSPHCTVYCGVA